MTWLPDCKRNPAGTDGGSHLGPVTIGVLHTTESTAFRPGSSYYGHTSWPHFTVHGSQVWQHIGLDRAARALKNRSGGVQTNREGCIQIEIVAKASEPAWSPMLLGTVARLMRQIEATTSIPPVSTVRWVAHPASYGERAGQRLTGPQWQAYRGWLGHQHVPENDHGDPGAIPIRALLDQEDDMTPEQAAQLARVDDIVSKLGHYIWAHPLDLPDGRKVPAGLVLAYSDAREQATRALIGRDPKKVAEAVVDLMGSDLAREVADELGNRIGGKQ